MRARFVLKSKHVYDTENGELVDVLLASGTLSGPTGVIKDIIKFFKDHVDQLPVAGKVANVIASTTTEDDELTDDMVLAITGAPSHQFQDEVGTVYDLLISPVP